MTTNSNASPFHNEYKLASLLQEELVKHSPNRQHIDALTKAIERVKNNPTTNALYTGKEGQSMGNPYAQHYPPYQERGGKSRRKSRKSKKSRKSRKSKKRRSRRSKK